MVEILVTVTKNGQATIPKELRDKHRIGKKVLVVDTKDGVLLKRVPDPLMEKGSLRAVFKGKTSKRIIGDARSDESQRV